MEKENLTAVEWFVKELFKRIDYIQVDPKLIEQAIAMEKEQIVDAWIATDNELQRLAADQYYNETYGK
jgi:hypothetical protein